MANTFIRKTSKGVGTSYFQVGANSAGVSQTGAYTVTGSGTVATVIGLSVSNVTSSSVDIDVALSATMANTTNDVSICKTVPLPAGSTIVLVGGDQKLVLIQNDLIKVKSSTASSLDVVMSMLEIT